MNRQARASLSASRAPVVPLSTSVPGRVRVRVRRLRAPPLAAARVEARFGTHVGARRGRATPAPGGVLVFFDARVTTRGRLIREIERYVGDLGARTNGGGPSLETRWHAEPADSVIETLGTSTT